MTGAPNSILTRTDISVLFSQKHRTCILEPFALLCIQRYLSSRSPVIRTTVIPIKAAQCSRETLSPHVAESTSDPSKIIKNISRSIAVMAFLCQCSSTQINHSLTFEMFPATRTRHKAFRLVSYAFSHPRTLCFLICLAEAPVMIDERVHSSIHSVGSISTKFQ